MAQLFQALRKLGDELVRYTPDADVPAGAVVVIGDRIGVTSLPIPAGEVGNLNMCGTFDFVKDSSVFDGNDNLYWDVDGNPVGGTAGTGAVTSVAAGNIPLGFVPPDESALTGDEKIRGVLFPFKRPRKAVQTVAAAGNAQGNAAQLIEGLNLVTGPDDAKGVILPVAVPGMEVTIKVGDGADLKVYPATGAAINGLLANAAMTVVDDVCFTLHALSATQWYTTPLLPS